MKALSVAQPWASVICSGIKDVENRLWQSTNAPGRILIHATKTKVPGNFEATCDDYRAEIRNARLMGQIPEYDRMPYGAIIGYVDCHSIVRDSDSFWAQPDSFHWCLRDAYLFDEPIPDVKGVRGHLFDVDMDERNLPPAHKVTFLEPKWDGTTLIMPAAEAVMEMVESGVKDIEYALNRRFFAYFEKKGEDGIRVPENVKFVCGDRSVTKDVETIEWGPYLDDDDKPITYLGYDGEELDWSYLAIILN